VEPPGPFVRRLNRRPLNARKQNRPRRAPALRGPPETAEKQSEHHAAPPGRGGAPGCDWPQQRGKGAVRRADGKETESRSAECAGPAPRRRTGARQGAGRRWGQGTPRQRPFPRPASPPRNASGSKKKATAACTHSGHPGPGRTAKQHRQRARPAAKARPGGAQRKCRQAQAQARSTPAERARTRPLPRAGSPEPGRSPNGRPRARRRPHQDKGAPRARCPGPKMWEWGPDRVPITNP